MGEDKFGATDLAVINNLFYILNVTIIFLKVLKFVIRFCRHAGAPVVLTDIPFSEEPWRVFTQGCKNGNLGINLLMNDQFKKINEKTKAFIEGKDPLARSFPGALFKDSSWVFAFDPSIDLEKSTETPPAASAASRPPTEKEKSAIELNKKNLSLVLFVGDTFQGEGEDLLGKMIQAMKLRPGEFNRVSFNEKLEDIENLSENLISPTKETKELFEQIEKYRPAYVVSLGATVTNILLGKREKLSGIHGQFFDKVAGSHHYHLMPLFHPEFLIINPNMKRTAWIDLQKVMERVGKI